MTFSQSLRSFRPALHQFVYVCVVFAFTLTIFSGESQGCFLQKNAKKYGRTYPPGDIVLHVGDPLELFCTIDLEKVKEINCSVENLIFYKDARPVDARYQTRVNETTIRLYVENQTESEIMYYCYLERNQSGDSSQFNSLEVTTGSATAADRHPLLNMVCMNWVAVGKEPREVENYTCVSLNWQVLNCSWDVPKNYVKTTYKIQYTPKHRYSERMDCPNDDDVNYNFCTWTLRTTPMYRKNFEVLKIIITGTNKFKSNEQPFFFNHYGHIIMDQPKELKYLAKNTTSITLQWDIGDLQYFPKPLHYKILYKNNNTSDWDTTFFDQKNSTRDGRKVTCTIGGLICNKVYNFRVFMKSSLASDKYWSNFTSQLFTTNNSRPAHAPFTDIGSFEIVQYGANKSPRTVYVYWQPLKMAEQCGDNFTYDITAFEVSDKGIERTATDVKRIDAVGSYAKYEIGASRYRFEIRSVNKEGAAPGASSVIVPAAPEEGKQCNSFTKTDYQQTDNCTNMYELSWQPPTEGPAVDNYTIFWCQSDKERPYQCNGYVEWKNVVSNMSKEDVCINSTDTYQFAISANTGRSSSGILWATCSVPHNHLGTVRQVYARVTGPTHIEVAWKLECADQASTVKGFSVTYCMIAGPSATACVPNTNHTVRWWSNHTLVTSGNLTNLQPYTSYRVTICMFNADREGQSSVPVVLRTAEGAPNIQGVKLNLMNRTNTSVTIGWELPRQMNGELHHYSVVWRQQQQELQVRTTQVTIPNLDPYTKYNVTVKACTSMCSPEIGPIEVSTGVGKPGKVETIMVEQQDQGTLVKWDPPSQLAGPHPYYEVHLLKDNVEKFSNRTNGTHMLLPKPDCSTDHNAKYEVRVYAINLDDKRDTVEGATGAQLPAIYKGDKSPAYLLNCTDGVGTLWKILMWTTFPVLLMVFVGYGSRQLYYKCRQMKDIGVEVPMKFNVYSASSKGEDLYAPNYTQVLPPRQADEFSTLVDKMAEQSV